MTATSAGTWSVRIQDPITGKPAYETLGEFSELPDHQRFDAAQREAMRILGHVGKGGIANPKTIKDCCELYVAAQERAKGSTAAKDARNRFAAYVLDDARFADLKLADLTPAHMTAWRNKLADRPSTSGANRGGKRSDSTLNRDMTPFRAALNLAFEEGWVTSEFAWKSKLKPIPNADKRRELYLDRAERARLIEFAAPDVALLIGVMCVLPLRPGALANLTVSAYDPRLKQLTIKIDKTGSRKILLPERTAAQFADAIKGRPQDAPLFTRANGAAWDRYAWRDLVKVAAADAGLSDETVIYTLRHSAITDMVVAGVDLLTIAQLAGTSVRMIEKHYGHLRNDIAAKALEVLYI